MSHVSYRSPQIKQQCQWEDLGCGRAELNEMITRCARLPAAKVCGINFPLAWHLGGYVLKRVTRHLWGTLWQHDQQVVRPAGKSGSGQKVDPAARAGSPSCCAWHVLRLVAQSCLTLWDPMNCSPPCSSIHGDSPGKNTGVGDLPNPGIEPTSPALQADSFTVRASPEERL